MKKWLQNNIKFGFSYNQIIYFMNHVSFPPLHYHNYSCLRSFDLCEDNFVTTTFSSSHTGFYTLWFAAWRKYSLFFLFDCIMPNFAYCLYCIVCLNVKQKVALRLNFFSSLSPYQCAATFSLLSVLCSISSYNTNSHKSSSLLNLLYNFNI